MVKTDFKKELKELFTAKKNKVTVIQVPELQYLMIDGTGYPGTSQEYQDAMATLYPVSYTLKFIMKAENMDFVVMPLEGLWWADDMEVFSSEFMENKDDWKWTSMIMQPSFVTQTHFEDAVAEIKEKGKEVPSLGKLRFERVNEGTSAQILHVGPYSEEGPTIQIMHSYIDDMGGTFDGLVQKHHEIYLSDPRRTKPENLKTIIRQPFVI
ncbi:MAG: GyrI-like domain-containing protein [Candidatus Kariarchaeaceae archaeon]|jgi:hypothetical protein